MLVLHVVAVLQRAQTLEEEDEQDVGVLAHDAALRALPEDGFQCALMRAAVCLVFEKVGGQLARLFDGGGVGLVALAPAIVGVAVNASGAAGAEDGAG